MAPSGSSSTDTFLERERQQVNEILRLLKDIGFSDVNGGPNFRIDGKQIDILAGHEQTLLVFECTTQRNPASKLPAFKGNIPVIVDKLQSHHRYKEYTEYKFIFATKFSEVTETLASNASKSKPRVIVWDHAKIKHFKKLKTSLGCYAKYAILVELGVKPSVSEALTVPAFSIPFGARSNSRSRLYLFFTEAKKLTGYAAVARRELGNES